MKKASVRFLSLLLTLCMVVGMMPITAWAATDTVLDAAIFCSDVHGSSSDLTSVLGGVKTSGVDYSAIGFVGDTCLTVADTTSTVQSALGDTDISVMFSYAASHDTENDADISSNWNYSCEVEDVSGYYLVYTIRETDMQNSSNAETAAPAFTTWYNSLTAAEKALPIFIMSHRPLHDRRDDNAGAAAWYDAISAAAESSDIVFFWAHNHTGETGVDTAAYYVAKDGDETFTVYNGDTVTPNFTYMNAGYINANGQDPARKGVATTVQITADSLIFQDYNKSGTYNGSNAHNVTVAREFTAAEAVLESIAVTTLPTKTAYAAGEEMDTTGMVVTGTYRDGSTAEVTGWYTSGVDMSTAGEKTVTVNYAVDGITYQTTFTITVEEGPAEGVALTGIEITSRPTKTEYLLSEELSLNGMTVVASFSDGSATELMYKPFSTSTVYGGYELDDFSMYVEKEHEVTVSYTYGEVTCTDTFTINVWNEDFEDESTGVSVHLTGDYGVTGVTVSESANEYVAEAIAEVIEGTNYAAYDINLVFDNGYETTNAQKTVTLPIPAGVTDPVVYYVSDAGDIENMNASKSGSNVTFTTTHFSTYVVGESTEITVPEPTTATVTGTTTTEEKTVYVLVSTPTANNQYLIVSANAAGSAYALKENTTTGTSVTINAAGNGVSAPYIETSDNTIKWNANSGMTFQSENGKYYLRQSQSGGSRSLSFSTRESTDWTVGTNSLSYEGQRNTYYVSGGSTWSLGRSSSSVYFYEQQTVNVTTSANGTYSIAGEDVEKVVVEGSTATLSSILTFVPESGATTTTDTSADATYAVVDGGDPNGIISGISGNTVTFSGEYGTALVKVSYTKTINGTGYTVDNYILVTAKAPTYTVEITRDNAVVTATIPVKGVTSDTTLQLGTSVSCETADGTETITPEEGSIEWSIPAEYQNIAAVDEDTGLISFTGKSGTFYVTVTYTTPAGKTVEDTITINATRSEYSVPEDGTNDFPEYPNEGAIRFDKTATAVGNFSETGIAQVELSMTGVNYTTGSEIDVVIMMDMTGSMSDTAMAAAEEAAIAFAESIVKNEDGTYNNNRIAVLAFNSSDSSPFTYWELGTITANEWDSFCTAVRGASDDQASGGTPYDEALEECYNILNDAKTDGTGNDRQQFCVFMSDGGPTSYEYITNYDAVKAGTDTAYTTASASATGGQNQSDSNFAAIATYTHEYYSTLMKDNGVTMYSVLTGLAADDYPNCATIMENIASDSSKAYVVENGDDTTELSGVLSSIGQEIRQAATDVVVEDKIADNYTMIFDIPTGSKDITGVTNDFYIEFVEYTLDSNHERSGDPTTLTKLYLGVSNGTYYAASDSTGTAYAAPVFEAKTLGDKGTLYFWTTDASKSSSGISYTSSGTTYYFVPYGMKAADSGFDANAWFNITSGAYASGTINSTTNMSEDLLIVTPYFVYSAVTRMLYWTVDKLTTTEYALRYFLYLDNSATEVGTDKETEAGSYVTNDHAYLTYTNFNGEDCRQKFPVPQQTWSGAQVSYVFYLVDETGTPINMAGQTVDFANATFVSNVYTESTVWNKGEDGTITADSQLSVDWLADELLPDVYTIYDESAGYELKVYGSHTGESIFDYFTIEGGTAAEISDSLNTRLALTTTSDTVSTETTKVYNTKAGTKYSAYGTYTSEATEKYEGETVLEDFDFYNTTVAFAVVWKNACVDDSVVIDYGLPVDISVLANDMLDTDVTLVGVSKTENGTYASNVTLSYGTAAISGSKVRYTPTSMQMSTYDTFWYQVNDPASDGKTYDFYGTVTVIPATTIYYEEGFATIHFANSSVAEDTNNDGEVTAADTGNGIWRVVGDDYHDTDAIQDEDRPGEFSLSYIDANNLYGFDSTYTNFTQYSLDGAMKVTVDAATAGGRTICPTASFTFAGTGFDIISLTDWDSGAITVTVADESGAVVEAKSVDNYYGYTYDETDGWVVDETSMDTIWQVPVIKFEDLPYGTYTATIYVMYSTSFDHRGDNENGDKLSYSFWLDAIRIYDPANDGAADGTTDTTIEDAYTQDGEISPSYVTLRDLLVAAGDLDAAGVTNGAVFIDGKVSTESITDYANPGPNNETYLAGGQGVSFKLLSTVNTAAVQLGAKLAKGDSAALYLNGKELLTLETATDMYYELPVTWTLNTTTNYYESGVIVLSNGTAATADEEGNISFDTDDIISITNLKAIGADWNTSLNVETASAPEDDGTAPASEEGTYSLRSAGVAAVSEEVSEEEVTSEMVEVQETGMGFRMKLSGVRGNKLAKYEARKNREAGGETAAEAATYGLVTTAEITAIVDTEVVATALAVMNELKNPTVEEPEEVVDPFVPEHFECLWERSRNGRKATLTVTTSEDVEYISINGEIFTEYETKTVRVKTEESSNGGFFGFGRGNKGFEKVTYRVWTVSYKSNSRETLEAEVVFFNADGLASEAIAVVDEAVIPDRNNGRR